MKKAKSTKKKNRFVIIAIIIVLLVSLASLIGVFILKEKQKNNKEELQTLLTKMGETFYENFYYEQVGSSSVERSSKLSNFNTIGIKINLDNLERYNNGEFKEQISKFINKKTNTECNKTNTKVIIYPKSPYGKNDYRVATELDCGFEEDK